MGYDSNSTNSRRPRQSGQSSNGQMDMHNADQRYKVVWL